MWYEDEDEDDIAMLVEDYSQPLLPPDQTSTPEETIVRMSRAVPELTWRELRRLIEWARKSYGSARRIDPQSAEPGGESRVAGESSATESRVTEPPDQLPWGQTYLPEHFCRPPSAMHRRVESQVSRVKSQTRSQLIWPSTLRSRLSTFHGVEIFRQFRPDAFGVEGNQYQDLLAPEFEAEFRRQGMLGVQPWPIYRESRVQSRESRARRRVSSFPGSAWQSLGTRGHARIHSSVPSRHDPATSAHAA